MATFCMVWHEHCVSAHVPGSPQSIIGASEALDLVRAAPLPLLARIAAHEATGPDLLSIVPGSCQLLLDAPDVVPLLDQLALAAERLGVLPRHLLRPRRAGLLEGLLLILKLRPAPRIPGPALGHALGDVLRILLVRRGRLRVEVPDVVLQLVELGALAVQGRLLLLQLALLLRDNVAQHVLDLVETWIISSMASGIEAQR